MVAIVVVAGLTSQLSQRPQAVFFRCGMQRLPMRRHGSTLPSRTWSRQLRRSAHLRPPYPVAQAQSTPLPDDKHVAPLTQNAVHGWQLPSAAPNKPVAQLGGA